MFFQRHRLIGIRT